MESGCILSFQNLSGGYARIFRDGRLQKAHRLAYLEVHGSVPDGFHVHHRCGTKNCVNPEHLVALSPADHHAEHVNQRREERLATRISA